MPYTKHILGLNSKRSTHDVNDVTQIGLPSVIKMVQRNEEMEFQLVQTLIEICMYCSEYN